MPAASPAGGGAGVEVSASGVVVRGRVSRRRGRRARPASGSTTRDNTAATAGMLGANGGGVVAAR